MSMANKNFLHRGGGMRPAMPWQFRYLIRCVAAGLFLVVASMGASQDISQPEVKSPFSDDLKKYPGLLIELDHLIEALKKNVQFPPARTQSQLLQQLPEETTFYLAFPNYGETAQQTLQTLRQQLQVNDVLRDWWQHGELSSAGPKLEDFLEKFHEISQYLGDEVIVAGSTKGISEKGAAPPKILLMAEVRKAGLNLALRQMLKGMGSQSQYTVRVLDPRELAEAKNGTGAQQLVILVRPDFVVASENVEALRGVNSLLDAKTMEFPATPFGQKITRAYGDGTSILLAADLHTIISQSVSASAKNQKILERTGFKDAEYGVWQHRHIDGGSVGKMELSFVGPRHGIAAWLAAPGPLGSLQFVSPQAAIVSSVRLKNLGEIFDDIKDLSADSNPNAFASETQMEKAMHISLKDDLLSLLPGEITVEADAIAEPKAEWKVILRVTDAEHFQQSLTKVLATMGFQAKEFEADGIQYHSVTIPSAAKPTQIVYTFDSGYMIVASSQEKAAEGIRLRQTGQSFANFEKFKETLPAGSPAEVSALLYEDPSTTTALNLRRLSPEMAQAFSRLSPPTSPVVFRAYGEESAIRGVSSTGGADPSVILVAAAVAIPNLMRARMAANESSAVANLRTINTAQVAYSSAYPGKGYASDLANLGPDPRGPSYHSSEHASLIDGVLGNPKCTANAWCAKSGYNFRLVAECKGTSGTCKEFVAVATPESRNTGSRNFCSTSDGFVRYKMGAPLISEITSAECRRWMPVQ
jgi:type II secretory pathway pseudopilin PulG